MSRSKNKRTIGDQGDLSLLTDGLEAGRMGRKGDPRQSKSQRCIKPVILMESE